MASSTPAEHLARLKIAYPAWKIWRGETTNEWWASPPPGHSHPALLNAADLDGLEVKLAESRHGS